MDAPAIYRVLADLVVVVHFLFILFVLFGGLLAFRWRWVPWLHIPMATWGAVVEFFGWLCPLTPLENSLRRAGGTAHYSGDFIERYLMPLIYIEGLTRQMQLMLGVIVVGFNLLVYSLVWYRRRASRAQTNA